MSLANGSHYLAIPGPSVAPEAVLRAMHRSAPNIYTGELHDITHSLVPDLKAVARTDQHVAMYIANGHGAWEASLVNVLSRGDKVLVLATGRFGEGWANMARTLGADVTMMDFGRRSPIDLAQVEEALSVPYKAILAVHTDTATSIRNDIQALGALRDRLGHGALLMVDSIACLGCDPMEMDAWGVDVLVTGSQKGLMTPPGMSFVFFNDRANAARDQANMVTPYWDWRPRIDPQVYYQYFCGTAPTHHLYGLRAALDILLAEGVEAVWARHAHLARALWAAMDRWSDGGPLEPNVANRSYRSTAVTAVRLGTSNGDALRHWTETQAGLTLGIGLGMETEEDPGSSGFFRIGHMGHVNAQMLMGCLGSIQAGLKAIQVPHGAGALEAAAEVLGQPIDQR